MTKEDLEILCIGLPPVLKGVTEVCIYLGLPRDFVRRWSEQGGGEVPPMPNALAQGARIFPTAGVMRWLFTHHDGRGVKDKRGAAGRAARESLKDEG